MAFFNDLGKKLSQAGQATMQKTKEFADVAKLNSMISDEERRINQAYTEIGKLYFEHHANDSEEMFTGLIQSIHEANEKIVDLRNQAAEIKGVAKCPKCGAEVAKNAAFCGACGNPIPAADSAQEQAATTQAEQAPAVDPQTVQEQIPAAEASAEMPDSTETM